MVRFGPSAAGLVALVTFAVACSDNPAEVNPNPACAQPFPAFDPANPVIRIRGFAFQPSSATVSEGTTVTWINCEVPGVEPHTTTANGGGWDSGNLSPGAEFMQEFPAAGTFAYHCTPHPQMTGTVVVQ